MDTLLELLASIIKALIAGGMSKEELAIRVMAEDERSQQQLSADEKEENEAAHKVP